MAGAIALNLLHESVRRFDKHAPRVDLVGEEALTKGLKAIGTVLPKGQNLYSSTLAAELLSNALIIASSVVEKGST